MNRLVTFLLAVMLAIFNASAEQPPSTYMFTDLVASKSSIGGHTFTPDSVIDGVALSDSGEIAFVSHWSEAGKERSAVFTSKRIIARDGDTLGGKFITRITATALAINRSGQVAFEATYGEPSETGIFVDRKPAVIALSEAGSANDFVLADDGKVTLKAATAAQPTAPAGRPATAGNYPNPQRGVLWKIPGPLARVILGPNSPIANADPNVVMNPQKPPQRPPQAQQTQQQRQAAPVRACTTPAEFPYPAAWTIGDEMIGPIASHIFDPAKGKSYESRIFGRIASPFRSIQCGADGKPLLIVIGDNAHDGRFELHTPNGLLSFTKPDGYLALPGFSGNVLPGLVVRADTPLKINRHGQVLMPVTVEPAGFALLLATPNGGPR